MKKLSFISFILIFGTMAFAEEEYGFAPAVLVKNVVMKGDLMPVRGQAEDPITTTFEVEVYYCRNVNPKQFKLQAVTTLNNETTVEFLDTMFDCMGPARRQTLKLKTTSIPYRSSIMVKNPLLVEEQITR